MWWDDRAILLGIGLTPRPLPGARGGQPSPPATQRFLDVSPSSSFYAFIGRMPALGITAGCTGTNYCPRDPVTRAGIAVFLVKGLNLVSTLCP
jgi:hypothetical protein